MVLHFAAYDGCANLCGKHGARPFAASPDLTATVAGLAAFGGINAEQPHPIACHIQSIAIDNMRLPFQRQRPDRGGNKGKDKNKKRTND